MRRTFLLARTGRPRSGGWRYIGTPQKSAPSLARVIRAKCAPRRGWRQHKYKKLSRLFRNVPILNLLEMSPFVDVEQNVAVAQYEQGWGARGGRAATEPLPSRPALY